MEGHQRGARRRGETDAPVLEPASKQPVLRIHMDAGLSTTNLILGIMAVVSVLEALVLIGLGIAGFRAYRRAMALIQDVEVRHVQPATARVMAILDDLKGVSAKVR